MEYLYVTLIVLNVFYLTLFGLLIYNLRLIREDFMRLFNKVYRHDEIFNIVAEDTGTNYSSIKKMQVKLDVYEEGLYNVMKELEGPRK